MRQTTLFFGERIATGGKASFSLVALFALLLVKTTCYADAYNSVRSITVKNTEVTKPITKKQADNIFSKNIGSANAFSFSQCTGNYELYFSRKEYEARFEAFQEFNPQRDLSELTNTNLSSLNGKLWVSIESTHLSSYPIRIENKLIHKNMTFKEFKNRFPQSADAEIKEAESSDKSVKKYAVLFVKIDDGSPTADIQTIESGALPYTSFIEFVFKNRVIKKISIWQGMAC